MAKISSWKRMVVLLFATGALVALATSQLWAVVNQVDGQVVPVESSDCPGVLVECVQTGLDFGEGILSPGSVPSPIDAILDAQGGPGIFLIPKSGGKFVTVRFRLLLEGAGFENIFGWYNVGSPQVRYPVVFSCKDGDRSLYEGASQSGSQLVPGYEVSVDFEAEKLAGHYTEGQIGFYLISPEDSPNDGRGGARNNCATDPFDALGVDDDNADDGNDGIDDEGFGRVYFTETELNNDGNYVHFLVYQGQNTEHFYFGFEDLFRGGDNDYDDTLVKVEGLVPLCEASEEVCNGLDDNCNGQIDEVSRPCANACGVAGVEQCDFDEVNKVPRWTPCDAPAVPAEVCDGVDNDCDGVVDEQADLLPDHTGENCTSADGCPGTRVCRGGGWVCDAPAKTTEICDGKDNNCNTLVDEGVTRPCTTACGPGSEACQFDSVGQVATWINCSAPPVRDEICDGKDNDCNDVIDDGLRSRGPCTASSGCPGQEICRDGGWICDAPPPSIEICDGLDNDCNGDIDDGVTRACFSTCGFGSETCNFSDDSDPANDWIGCTAKQPEDEVCDGVDNNCDGIVDNDVPGEDEPCEAPADACEAGRTKCVGGELICVAKVGSPEVCDCQDNDCDGDVDEGDLCSGIAQCVDCACRIPCENVEFACPSGLVCTAGFCLPDKCADVECGANEKCVDGECRNLCTGVSCKDDMVCVDGGCVLDNCYGKGCAAGQICLDNECVDNPCADVACEIGEYCNSGACLASCGRVICGEGSRCVDGVCETDPCAGVLCAAGIRCIDGKCDDECVGVTCGVGRRCDRGACVDDPCTTVDCTGPDERCIDGQCVSPYTFSGRRVELLATGKGGFDCSVGGGGRPSFTFLLLVSLVALMQRRRRRSR